MVTFCVIPARYGSLRFPGKPLALIKDKPLVQHVYEKAKASKLITEVFVATDDIRIFNTVKHFGGNAIMTSSKHPSGTDRISEAVDKLIKEGYSLSENSIIINLQGDEPFIKVEMINQLVRLMKKGKNYIGTLVKQIEDEKDFQNPNIVKVVFNEKGYALYFSRSPIPFNRERFITGLAQNQFMYKHIGIYGYTVKTLKKFVSLPQSALEKIESLEQLRALENGIKIKVSITEYDSFGIDTPDDLKTAEKLFSIFSQPQ
ncbi:MAG: 3-deoxy-manno-octulosonate cytidylyltransferase [Thermodesulfovibrio sp.]|nr:3-deoxy-manno-octulosonate cytidylyltransferase [Thermodesulfovibrio sp.]MDW7998400.1 3-deoxy-manno-octulosonate cytidylyltransferase [Thermodesulfovibrio sp.]